MSDYQKREAKAVAAIKKAIPLSLKKDMIKECKGLFCELYENKEVCPNHYIATACDGVGTKIILAEAMGIYNTIGIDLVAMNANDMATFGQVSPFLFINYLATQHKIQEQAITGDIIRGILKGLEMSDAADVLQNSINVNLGKGETASVDELLSATKPGYGFDVAGAMIGFIRKDALNFKITPGDKIIALKSSGPHSNGYTDLRLKLLKGDFETRKGYKKRYTGKFKLNDKFENSTIGKTLLEPTKIYVKSMAAIAKKFKVVGVNNTGYGLKNLNRYKGNFEFNINDPIEPQPIFNLVQKEAKFTDEEMYRKFNMGMGFFVIAKKEDAESVLSTALKFKEEAKVVGEVKPSSKTRTVLEKDAKKIVFEGY